MQILASALEHGLTDDEIRHAWTNALGFFTVDAGTEPPKGLCIGPDPAGNLLEIPHSCNARRKMRAAMAAEPQLVADR